MNCSSIQVPSGLILRATALETEGTTVVPRLHGVAIWPNVQYAMHNDVSIVSADLNV